MKDERIEALEHVLDSIIEDVQAVRKTCGTVDFDVEYFSYPNCIEAQGHPDDIRTLTIELIEWDRDFTPCLKGVELKLQDDKLTLMIN